MYAFAVEEKCGLYNRSIHDLDGIQSARASNQERSLADISRDSQMKQQLDVAAILRADPQDPICLQLGAKWFSSSGTTDESLILRSPLSACSVRVSVHACSIKECVCVLMGVSVCACSSK
jgi:hypothetical protein